MMKWDFTSLTWSHGRALTKEQWNWSESTRAWEWRNQTVTLAHERSWQNIIVNVAKTTSTQQNKAMLMKSSMMWSSMPFCYNPCRLTQTCLYCTSNISHLMNQDLQYAIPNSTSLCVARVRFKLLHCRVDQFPTGDFFYTRFRRQHCLRRKIGRLL